jgi:competence ComEA-like helix-hairpin-helix protein
MYAKGDLYPQAIAELRAALADDQQRLDLQVVLADVYGRAGQRVEAASICNGLLRKLPYCLIANQVMADILADSERAEDARVYRQRAQALDAYLAHTSPGAPTPDKVPDIAVSIERLDWQPGKLIEGSSQPDWAASLGVELETGPSQKEEIPDWLSAVQTDADQAALPAAGESSAAFTDLSATGSAWTEEMNAAEADVWPEGQSPDAAQLSSEAEIPDWMKDAGWSPSTGVAEEESSGFGFDEEDLSAAQPEAELEEASLPDWLKEIAPENLDQASATLFEESDWDQPSDEDATILESTPDWFQEAEDEDTGQEESPDWLAELTGAAATAAVTGAVAGAEKETSAEPAEDLPDWLKAMEAEEGSAPEDQIPDLPLEAEAEAELPALASLDTPAEATEASELPDWLDEIATEKEIEPTTEPWSAEISEAEPADEIPDWLKEMEAETGETIVSEPELASELEPAEDLPDWLQEMAPEREKGIEPEPSMELPDWMAETEAETGVGIPEAAIADETASAEETPDWLQEVAAGEIVAEAETAKIEIDEEAIPTEELQTWMIESKEEPAAEEMAEYQAEQADEMPDWLIDMQAEAETGAIRDQLPEAVADSDAEIEAEIEAGAEALPDEGMAVITPPEQIEEEMGAEIPELLWQDEEIEPGEQIPAPSAGLEEGPQLDEMDVEAAFAWLESLAVKQGADEALLLSSEERTETPPEWVQSAIEAATKEEEQAETSSEAAVEEISEMETEEQAISTGQEEFDWPEAIPDWLQAAGEDAETVAEPEEALPDWLQEAGEYEIEELEEPAQPAEELPDWLKSMQIEDEAAPARLEAEEELPDWLQELPEEAEEQEPLAEPQADWLAGLEEPLIEGDTKPTRLGLESRPEDFTIPEDSPTLISPASETEDELSPSAGAETEFLQPQEVAEQPAADETQADTDADFAWLESLAVKQGADEALLLEPEERLEGPPEWIQAALDKQFGEDKTQENLDENVASAEEVASEAQPSMLEELREVPESAAETPELPDWLRDMETEAEQDETEEAIEAIVAPTSTTEQEEIPELPSWLAETEEQEEPVWTPAEPEIQKLDLNRASLAELERLPGIGFIMAQKIIVYREQNGPFSSPMDLQQIPGFSPSMVEDLEDRISVESVVEEPLSLPVEAGTPPELAEARRVMLAGSLEEALEKYSDLIFNKNSLDEVIYDLNQILLRHGNDAAVWQTLGDAQMRANLVQDALEAYTRAEQLF